MSGLVSDNRHRESKIQLFDYLEYCKGSCQYSMVYVNFSTEDGKKKKRHIL